MHTQIENVLTRAVEACDMLLWAYEWQNKVLRVFIYHKDGVLLDDCARVSRHISAVLDVEVDFLTGSYTLEVASPGVDRALSKPWHFASSIGKNIDLLIMQDCENLRVKGKLLRVDDLTIVVLVADQERSFSLNTIVKANLF